MLPSLQWVKCILHFFSTMLDILLPPEVVVLPFASVSPARFPVAVEVRPTTHYPFSPSRQNGPVWRDDMSAWNLMSAVTLFRWRRATGTERKVLRSGRTTGRRDEGKIHSVEWEQSHCPPVPCVLVIKTFDTDMFIECVHANPPLWDKALQEYSDRNEREKCWVTIGQTMFSDWSENDVKGKNLKS